MRRWLFVLHGGVILGFPCRNVVDEKRLIIPFQRISSYSHVRGGGWSLCQKKSTWWWLMLLFPFSPKMGDEWQYLVQNDYVHWALTQWRPLVNTVVPIFGKCPIPPPLISNTFFFSLIVNISEKCTWNITSEPLYSILRAFNDGLPTFV